MRQLRDVIGDRQALIDLLADIDDGHDDQRQRDGIVVSGSGDGRQQDQRKIHTAGSQQGGPSGQEDVHQPGHQRHDRNDRQEALTAVLFFQQRSDQQEQDHIIGIVFQVGVAQHMPEEADIEQRIRKGTFIDTEEESVGQTVCQYIGCQGQAADQGE